MKHTKYLMLAAFGLILNSCNNGIGNTADTKTKDDSAAAAAVQKQAPKSASMLGDKIGEKDGVGLYYFQNSPDFSDAELATEDMKKDYPANGKVSFHFNVKNYKLADQTEGHDKCNCNNSAKGQHIHLILNNKPYKALYKPEFDTALAPGHYVGVSFLSRSFHESIKNKTAFKTFQFNVGSTPDKDVNLERPMLIYSRPKGEYKGKDAQNILLDFYLLNTELSESGNKVVASVDGAEYTLSKWTGYAISGLKPGEHTISIKLVDKDGKEVDGLYTKTERKITVKE